MAALNGMGVVGSTFMDRFGPFRELQRRLKQPDKELRQSQVGQTSTSDISMAQLSLVVSFAFFCWWAWGRLRVVGWKPIRLRVLLEIDFYDYWLWLARLLLRVVVIYIDLNTSVNTNYRYTETISFVCRLRCRGPRFTDGFHLICTNHIMKPSILVTYSDVTGGCTPIDGSYAGVSLTLRLGIPTETDWAIETWPSWWW